MSSPSSKHCTALLTILVILVAVAVYGRISPHAAQAESVPAADDAMKSEATAWRGATSCAAAACHNAGGPTGSKGSEYTTWVTHDPHSKAFDKLFAQESLDIVNRLGWKTLPSEDARCVNCHAYQVSKGDLPAAITDGVGCENCHGKADAWLARHVTVTGRQEIARTPGHFGMRDTKEISARAESCTGCHIGDQDRDVNHDLIAAGHPRLAFEFSAHHARMPKHWDIWKEKRENPGFEAKAWAVGQVVSARAALELLAARASDESKPWPEFAEYNCFACHHDLQAESWRRTRDDKKSEPVKKLAGLGLPNWGTWYYPMLNYVPGGSNEVAAELRKLRDAVRIPNANRNETSAHARVALRRIENLLGPVRRFRTDDFSEADRLFKTMARDGQTLVDVDWDSAAQVYLAVSAFYHSRQDMMTFEFSTTATSIQEIKRMLDLRRLNGFDDAGHADWVREIRAHLQNLMRW